MLSNVLLFTQNIQEAREEIAGLGGQVTQQFTDAVLVANLPDTVNPQSLKKSTPNQPSSLDQISQLAVEAWKGLQDKTTRAAPLPTEGLSWDAPGRKPPGYLKNNPSTLIERSPERSTGTPTSLYMTGSVAVGVVIVSGTQPNLSLSSSEQQKIIQEVQEGLTFLTKVEPRAKLSFVYDIRLITVSVAPGSTNDYEPAEAPWRNAALKQMGFAANSSGSVQYVQKLKQSKGTNWAYVGYFTKYPLHWFAYAGGERVVMHYDNDGWGPDSINAVFAHETCHIFGAADEYGNCACGGSYGYLGIPNNNCKNCPGSHESCLMDANTLQICPWSRKQIGWDEKLFPGSAFKTSANWHNLPAGFTGSFDAALNGGGSFAGKCYFFKGDKYIRYDWSADKADVGYPKKISDGWHGLPAAFTSGFSDAVNGQKQFAGKCYFFKGDSYIRYDWASDKVDPGYPKKIADGWHGLPTGFTGSFDAIINGNGPFAGKCYFFKGDSYIRYDWASDKVDPGYPRKIADGWYCLPTGYTSGFNAALEGDKGFVGKGYFFKGDYYIRYDWAKDRADS